MAERIKTREAFDKLTAVKDKTVLIDFYADWCGPCKMISPVIESIEAEKADVLVGKVNVDEEAALALKYQIMSIPTLVVMKNGVFQNKAIGVQTKEEVLEILK